MDRSRTHAHPHTKPEQRQDSHQSGGCLGRSEPGGDFTLRLAFVTYTVAKSIENSHHRSAGSFGHFPGSSQFVEVFGPRLQGRRAKRSCDIATHTASGGSSIKHRHVNGKVLEGLTGEDPGTEFGREGIDDLGDLAATQLPGGSGHPIAPQSQPHPEHADPRETGQEVRERTTDHDYTCGSPDDESRRKPPS